MSILDAAEFSQANPTASKLLDVLAGMYPNLHDASAAAEAVGVNPAMLPQGAISALQKWKSILEIAARQGQLRQIVARAVQHFPGNGHAAFLTKLLESKAEPWGRQGLDWGGAPLRDCFYTSNVTDGISYVPLHFVPCAPRPHGPGINASNLWEHLQGDRPDLLVVVGDTRPDLLDALHAIALAAPGWTPERFTELPWLRPARLTPYQDGVNARAPDGALSCIIDLSDCPNGLNEIGQAWGAFLGLLRTLQSSVLTLVGLPRWMLADTATSDWIRSQPNAFTMAPRYHSGPRARPTADRYVSEGGVLAEAIESLSVANSNCLARAIQDALARTASESHGEDVRLVRIAEHIYQLGYMEDALRLEIFARTHNRRTDFVTLSADIEPVSGGGISGRTGHMFGFLPRAQEAPCVGARVVLGGGAGAGKTTTLLQAESNWALPTSVRSSPTWFPVLLRADGPACDLGDAIRQNLCSTLFAPEADPMTRRSLFAHKHVGMWASVKLLPYVLSSPILFLIDGITERSVDCVVGWLRGINTIEAETSVVVALRPQESLGVDGQQWLDRELGESHQVARLSLRSLNAVQLRELCVRNSVGASYAEVIAGPEFPATHALRNPYLSTRLLQIVQAGRNIQSDSAFTILESFVEHGAKNDDESLRLVREQLPAIAYSRKATGVDGQLSAHMHKVAQHRGLLDRGSSPDSPRFSHRLLEDFFACAYVAEELVAGVSPEQLLVGRSGGWASRWEHVVRMLFSRLDARHLEGLLNLVMKQDLRLANHCLMEMDPRRATGFSVSPSNGLLGRIKARGFAVAEIEESIRDANALGFLDPRLPARRSSVDLVTLLSRQGKEPVLIGRYPVTNWEFAQFVRADGYTRRELWKSEHAWLWRESIRSPRYWSDDLLSRPNAPVVGISVAEAEAYCEWLTRESEGWDNPINFSLPEVGDWDRAAGVVEGELTETIQGVLSRYVLKNSKAPPSPDALLAPLLDSVAKAAIRYTSVIAFNQETGGLSVPRPIGLFEPGASGCYDMIGHVWEWCYWQGSESGQRSPVVKGGPTCDSSALAMAVVGSDFDPYTRLHKVGFRLAGIQRKVTA